MWNVRLRLKIGALNSCLLSLPLLDPSLLHSMLPLLWLLLLRLRHLLQALCHQLSHVLLLRLRRRRRLELLCMRLELCQLLCPCLERSWLLHLLPL